MTPAQDLIRYRKAGNHIVQDPEGQYCLYEQANADLAALRADLARVTGERDEARENTEMNYQAAQSFLQQAADAKVLLAEETRLRRVAEAERDRQIPLLVGHEQVLPRLPYHRTKP